MSVKGTETGEVETQETQPATDPAPVNTASDPVFRLVLWAFAISGFCALSYEVFWTRILVFFLGSTTYAFSTMLAAFLFGIALGSFIFAWIADRLKSLVNLLGLVQIGIGLAAVALIPAFGGLYDISSTLQSMFGGGRFWAFVACVIVMSVPTLLMGISFPLVARIYTVNADKLGRSIGNVYALNTVGAILGAFCAGFIFIPLIGIRPGIVLMAALNLIVGCVLIFRNKNRSRFFNGAAVGGTILTAGIAIVIIFTANKPLFLKSAIFRTQRRAILLSIIKRKLTPQLPRSRTTKTCTGYMWIRIRQPTPPAGIRRRTASLPISRFCCIRIRNERWSSDLAWA